MGWGSDLCLPAVVLWNSAPHVSTMLGSNLDLSDSVLDILQSSQLFLMCLVIKPEYLVLWDFANKTKVPRVVRAP